MKFYRCVSEMPEISKNLLTKVACKLSSLCKWEVNLALEYKELEWSQIFVSFYKVFVLTQQRFSYVFFYFRRKSVLHFNMICNFVSVFCFISLLVMTSANPIGDTGEHNVYYFSSVFLWVTLSQSINLGTVWRSLNPFVCSTSKIAQWISIK